MLNFTWVLKIKKSDGSGTHTETEQTVIILGFCAKDVNNSKLKFIGGVNDINFIPLI